MNAAQQSGRDAARSHRNLPPHILSRLRRDPEFWEGFHRHRPDAFAIKGATVLEDPTRPGGWIFTAGP